MNMTLLLAPVLLGKIHVLIENLLEANIIAAPVFSESFSPDGENLASASDDNTIILWNLDFKDLLKRGCSWANDYLQNNRNVDSRDSEALTSQFALSVKILENND